jgi:predicted transcriptional regulator
MSPPLSPRTAAQDVTPDAAHRLATLARQYRRNANVTQFALATRAGISYARLVAFEQHRVQLRPSEIQLLLDALPRLREALSLLAAVAATERVEGDDGVS